MFVTTHLPSLLPILKPSLALLRPSSSNSYPPPTILTSLFYRQDIKDTHAYINDSPPNTSKTLRPNRTTNKRPQPPALSFDDTRLSSPSPKDIYDLPYDNCKHPLTERLLSFSPPYTSIASGPLQVKGPPVCHPTQPTQASLLAFEAPSAFTEPFHSTLQLHTMKLLLATAIALLFTVQAAEARLRLGLAWGTDNRWLKTIAKGNAEWYHHWQDGPVDGAPSSVQFVPMYWGPKYANLWAARKAEMKKKLPSRLLFVNEPDVESQSNLSPSRAAQLFVSEMVPWQKKGVKISSPQIVWNFDWMDSFMKKVKAQGVEPDFMAVHWYGSYKDMAGLKKFVTKAYKRYGLPVWVTEYGVTTKSGASASELADFMQEATSWLASQHYVKRAAWLGCFPITNPPDAFASAKNAFFNGDGSLRSMAKWYVGASLSKRTLSDSAAHVVRSPGAIRHLKGRNAHHREIARNLSEAAERDDEAEAPAVDDDDDEEESSTRSETDDESAHCDMYCKLRAESVANAKEDDDFLKGDDMGDMDALLD